MYNADYIGYKKGVGDIASSGANFARSVVSSGPKALASGGADISADIDLLMSGVTFVGNLFNQWTSHPARDARDFIKNAKPTISSLDPYNRLINVIALSKKINPKAIDVNAAEWILWYKQNYPNDYLQLKPQEKNYWNQYLNSVKQSYNNPNNMNVNLDMAMFTTSELNYNATPVETVKNIFTPVGGKTNYVLYGALAIGAILLIKYIKK